MPEYKLIYFNGRGRAELVRLIFHAAGTKFIDERIEGKDWPALKPKIPHGTLPAFYVDKQVFGQSLAIARYAAKVTGLAGKTPIEELRADEVVDTAGDYFQVFFKYFPEKDETKKAELKTQLDTKTIPEYLAKLTKMLMSNGGNFFVGKSLTWADLAVYTSLNQITGGDKNILDDKAELKAFTKRLEGLPKLGAYIKARPPSDI